MAHTNEETRETMARQIREAMAGQRITVAELMTRSKVSITVINHLRTAKGNPGINNILKVYRELGLKVNFEG